MSAVTTRAAGLTYPAVMLRLSRRSAYASLAATLLYVGAAVFAVVRSLQYSVAELSAPSDATTLLWPVAWMKRLPDWSADALFGLLAAVACVSLLLWRHRPVRIVFAVLYTMQAAYFSSFGKVNHNDHMLLWTLWIFALPPGTVYSGTTIADRIGLLRTFAGAQYLVAFFYFLSGFWKLIAGVVQLSLGEPSLFGLDAMPRHIAARLLHTNAHSTLGDWLIDHPLIATPLLWLAVYIEIATLLIVARPSLHVAWGFMLIALHLGIGLAMTIWFDANFLVVTCLFVLSPFGWTLSARAAGDLPGLRWLTQRSRTRSPDALAPE